MALGRRADRRDGRDRHDRSSTGRSIERIGSHLGCCRCGLGPLLGACLVVGSVYGGAVAAVLFAFVSGSLWGAFAVLTKDVVARLNAGGWAMVRTPELGVWLLLALGGLVWSQSAFRAGPLTASMPVLQVSQPVVAAVLGVLVLGETVHTGHVGMIALMSAAVVTAAAVLQLARIEAAATRNAREKKTRRRLQTDRSSCGAESSLTVICRGSSPLLLTKARRRLPGFGSPATAPHRGGRSLARRETIMQPRQRLWCPPTPRAKHMHESRNQNRSHQGGIGQHRKCQA